ncbi:helix-turn-helix domain-containing protein [Bradyrhizobium sp. 62B]|uniref:AraC family transcriptional regulator n=1 Tax=Bradyrhizobium sp. 62B TaxID=2898442 RepID=UPI002557E770|nr:helix-turn-helix domain-containing protein [Bradyrhizobium sp. 62B]
MAVIPLTRCQFILPFANLHSSVGGPTASLLAKFQLPTSLEEKPHLFVPLLPAVRFAVAAQDKQGLSELAFRAAQLTSFEHLSEVTRTRIRHAPTLLVALQHACRWASLEDTTLQLWMEPCGASINVCSRLLGTDGVPRLEMSQWLQNIFAIHIVRQFAGANWAPRVIAFEANYAPGIEVQHFWPNTRFLSCQKASWIEVPLELVGLANPANDTSQAPSENEPQPIATDVISVLKLALPAYLDEGGLSIMQAAEMVRLSVRSLQRKLSLAGMTYAGLLERARFNNAIRLLGDTEIKIIDIAFSSGYGDPAHFTRAFRRISGCTPREFRLRSRSQHVEINRPVSSSNDDRR